MVLLGAAAIGRVFSGAWVLPQTFSLGPLSVRYYGLCLAVAAGAGYLLARRRAGAYGFSTETIDAVFPWLVVGGFVGARLYHVASEASVYIHRPAEALYVWNGGLSIFGAVLGGAAAAYWFAHRRQLAFPKLADWLAPSLALGQALGRFGNFFNYELYGGPTDLPWEMFVPEGFRVPGFETSAFFHPLFLYEAVGSAAVVALLLYLSPRLKGRPGALFALYVMLYNTLRFALEPLRLTKPEVFGFPLNALVSAAVAIAALLWLVFARRPGDAR